MTFDGEMCAAAETPEPVAQPSNEPTMQVVAVNE